jgi:enamine deaminase RidA (YjgF/YER057c/UK114 family)
MTTLLGSRLLSIAASCAFDTSAVSVSNPLERHLVIGHMPTFHRAPTPSSPGRKIMLRTHLLTLKRSAALLALLFTASLASAAQADEPRLSVSGYDPVAYFTDGKPVPGKAEFEYVWHKSRWRFASGEHRDLFIKDPDRYAPQYDGYCALGASIEAAAHKDTVDPEAWAIVDGKLYLVHSNYWLAQWRQKAREYIKQADKDWQSVADLPDPVVVGSPCATSPPTNAVTMRDGKRLLVIGAQVPRDEAGNVVGKGDMRAQIEQVGKNVGACLKVAGATVNDIAFTITSVTAPADFEKYADLRARYFGPPSPDSKTVPTAQLSNPDFLLQVEAFAATK